MYFVAALKISSSGLKNIFGSKYACAVSNGTAGQMLTVIYIAQGNASDSIVITPSTKTGYTTVTLTDIGDAATFHYVNDTVGWFLVGGASGSAGDVGDLAA